MKPRRESESTKKGGRGRPLGSIVFVVLFLLVVIFTLFQRISPGVEEEKLTVGEFYERLIGGEVAEFTVETDGEVKGAYRAVRRPSVAGGAASGVDAKSSAEHGPGAEPSTDSSPTAESSSGSTPLGSSVPGSIAAEVPRPDAPRKRFRLYYPTARERLVELQKKIRPLDPAPWEPQSLREKLEHKEIVPLEAVVLVKIDKTGEKRTRLFVDLIDSDGSQRYVEVAAKASEKGSGDLASITRLLKDQGAGLEVFPMTAGGGVDAAAPNGLLAALLPMLAPWLLLIFLFWFFVMRQMRAPGAGGGILGFGRSRAVLYTKENRTNVTFDDVAGIDEAKEDVKEVIEFLKNPQRFARLGGRIPRGILLVGSPGTGKTLLAKAIAGEAEVPFFSISGSDFVEMFVGVGASRVRDLFKQAKENAPCIIFLDEIDAVGRKRGSGLGGGHDEREQTLNAILVEMDGFDTNEGIIVCAATNRPDVLDPALLRPGRFDREVVIDPPDYKGREEILKVHARRVKLDPTVELKTVARSTPSFSGADLAALMNEAAILAVLRKRDAVAQEDLEEARDKVRFGRQKTSRVVMEEDRIVTARHESGHALAAALLPSTEPVHKVTIIPRGMALGATMRLPENDRLNFSRQRAESELSVLYGGRIAEEILGDDISSGASNDIARATDLARLMVCEWGFSSKIGPLRYAEKVGNDFLGSEISAGRFHSEDTAREIDQEVKNLCSRAYETTRRLLEEHRPQLERVTEALLLFETITGSELAQILAGKPVASLREESSKAKSPPPSPASPTKSRLEARPSVDADDLPEAGLAPA